MNDETTRNETGVETGRSAEFSAPTEGGTANTPAEAGTTNTRLDLQPALWASAAVLAVMFGLTWWAWMKIPEGQRIPVHWNLYGRVDAYGGKAQGLLLMPMLVAGLVGLFWVLPRLDPRGLNLARSRKAYTAVWLAMLVLMASVHGLIVMAAMGQKVDVGRAIPALVGLLFMVMGNYLGKIRSNFFVGIRTPWTLSSELSWNKTHRLGGWIMVLIGVLIVICAAIGSPVLTLGAIVAGVLALVVFSLVYSYFVWKSDPNKHATGS